MYFCNAKPIIMDYKQVYSSLFTESWQLIVEPTKFWEAKKEVKTEANVFTSFYLPLILLVGVAVFIGELISGSQILFSYAFFKSLREMLVYILQFYGAVYVTNELISGFKGEKDKEMVRLIVAYSLLPFIVASIITGLFPGLYVLSVIGLYGIYLFALGIHNCIILPEEYRVRYILLTILVNFLIFALLNLISWKVLQFFYAYGA